MIYDIIGIGIGPFNLGLAALTENMPNLSCLFADAAESFNWHPGLMIDRTRLQVPFYADLVTLADPTSKYSYMNFLKENKRLFRFAIHENYFPTRKEYNQYCQWVAGQLHSLRFNTTCTGIFYSEKRKAYGVQLRNNTSRNTVCHWSKHIVLGTGTVPHMPEFACETGHPMVFHSANYLSKKEKICQGGKVCIIGSGQSAAEIFYDLLTGTSNELHWYTRSPRFFPMEYAKLTLEMTSPGYIDHFFSLSREQKNKTLRGQDALYKGINFSLINEIYDQLYHDALDENNRPTPCLFTNCELKNITAEDKNLSLAFLHRETGEKFHQTADAVILATGYRQAIPECIEPLRDRINWVNEDCYNVKRNYAVDNGNSIFVQNADLYSHGFNSADLGLGPYRNAVILNTILGREHFVMENNIAFQTFGAIS